MDGLRRQVDAVKTGLAIIEQDTSVGGCFCFVDPGPAVGGVVANRVGPNGGVWGTE